MPMGCQRLMNEVSQVLVHSRSMFLHKDDREYMNLGSLGMLHGMGDTNVGGRQGGQRWVGKLA